MSRHPDPIMDGGRSRRQPPRGQQAIGRAVRRPATPHRVTLARIPRDHAICPGLIHLGRRERAG